MRYFLECSYKGTDFIGWQRQATGRSVQGTIEDSLTLLLRQPVTLNGSSRTDTGVHARQQFGHFETEKPIQDPDDLVYRLNNMLPKDIGVANIYAVNEDQHSRYDAIYRSYVYRFHAKKNPFIEDYSLYFRRKLNVELMNEAAALLMQHNDFQAFSKVNTDVATFNCHISEAYFANPENNELEFHIQANRFLRGMVRAIVGSLLEVGMEKWTLRDFDNVILSKDRNQAGMNVEPHGLTLEKVGYPDGYFDVIISK